MPVFKRFFTLKVVVFLVVLYIASIGYALFISSPTTTIFKREAFNSNQWFEDIHAGKEDNINDCMRGKMAQNLINQYLTPNLSKKDITQLLGDADRLSQHSVEYQLGWCGYNSQTSLYIEFENDQLKKAYILKK